MARTALVADEAVRAHDPGYGHPEQPARFTAIADQLDADRLREQMQFLPARAASVEELELVHTPAYLGLVTGEVASGVRSLSTGDTDVSGESERVARLASGSVLVAVEAVCAGDVTNAFCLVRPPGHHASAARGMGFCLYNNVAVAARYAQQRFGLRRIAIVDWDVHHGNGTQDIFYRDGTVLFFSTHEWPLYPGTGPAEETGEGDGAGLTINCPLPPGTSGLEVQACFDQQLIPALDSFVPDLILISAGFDSRIDDPLGHFRLHDRDFVHLTETLLDAADRHCQGRLISVLEGGYNLKGLALATSAHVGALIDPGT